MKNIVPGFVILTFLASLLLSAPVHAVGSASIMIHATDGSGSVVAGQEITCTVNVPKTGTITPPPQFSYPVTNSAGLATWQAPLTDGATYQCNNRTALTPDKCYAWVGASTGTMSLTDGQTKDFNFVASASSPATCTKAATPTAATSPTSSPAPAQASQQTSTTPTQQQTETVKLEITSMKLNGTVVPASKDLTIKQAEHFVIYGKAPTNATVVLTVHSDPVTAQVKSNSEGTWQFDLASMTALQPGSHSIEAAVQQTDGSLGESLKITDFTFAQKSSSNTTKTSAATTKSALNESGGNASAYLWPLVALAALVTAAIIAWLVVRKMKKSHTHIQTSRPMDAVHSDGNKPDIGADI